MVALVVSLAPGEYRLIRKAIEWKCRKCGFTPDFQSKLFSNVLTVIGPPVPAEDLRCGRCWAPALLEGWYDVGFLCVPYTRLAALEASE